MPPMRLGMKNTVRKGVVPLMPRVSSRATASAMTLMSSVDTTVKDAVKPKACANCSS